MEYKKITTHPNFHNMMYCHFEKVGCPLILTVKPTSKLHLAEFTSYLIMSEALCCGSLLTL